MYRTLDDRRFILALLLIALGFASLFQRQLPAQTFAPTRFTIVDAGAVGKPDVILIPGLNSSRSVWDGEAKLLAPNYRLHLVQVNGFAGQPAGANASGPILAPIVEELHNYIASATMKPEVIGHSMGGLLAMLLAIQHPEDVRKLIIVDALPTSAKMFSPDATPASIAPQLAVMKQQLANMPDDQYAAMQPMMAARLCKNPEGQEMVASAAAKSDRTVSLNAMLEDIQTDLSPDAAKITMPTLMLYPLETPMQKPEQIDALYQSAYKPLPNVTLKRIDNSRHFIMYDQPAQFDAALEVFLK